MAKGVPSGRRSTSNLPLAGFASIQGPNNMAVKSERNVDMELLIAVSSVLFHSRRARTSCPVLKPSQDKSPEWSGGNSKLNAL
jgi:hypothetical protein